MRFHGGHLCAEGVGASTTGMACASTIAGWVSPWLDGLRWAIRRIRDRGQMNEFEVVTVIGRPEPLVIRLAKKQAETGGENLKALLEENAL